MNFFAITRAALNNRLILVLVPLLAAVVAVAWTHLRPQTWMAESRFVLQRSDDGSSRLAGLAAQFGVSVGAGGGSSESIEFYQALIRSRSVLEEALRMPVDTPGARTLRDLLLDEDRSATAAVTELRRRVHVNADPRSSMVTVQVSLADRELAEQVNRRLLDLVNAFNMEKRRTSASAERQFVEETMQNAQRELEAAERSLERFRMANARFENSPHLMTQDARLQRAVMMRQEVYLTLVQAYEQARIDEVRNTPVITIVDNPEGSSRKTSSGLLQAGLIGAFWGLFLAMILAGVREALAYQRREHPEEFDQLMVDFLRRRRRTAVEHRA